MINDAAVAVCNVDVVEIVNSAADAFVKFDSVEVVNIVAVALIYVAIAAVVYLLVWLRLCLLLQLQYQNFLISGCQHMNF